MNNYNCKIVTIKLKKLEKKIGNQKNIYILFEDCQSQHLNI